MTTQQKQKMLQWADMLEKVDEEYFDMEIWMNCPAKDLKEHKCGSAACAAGYLIVFFPEDWVETVGVRHIPVLKENINDTRTWETVDDDVAKYFGISFNDSNYITSISEYDEDDYPELTPDIVAARIREVAEAQDIHD